MPSAATFATRVFEQHGPAVHRYFRRLTGNAAVADDLTQEVFLRIVRSAADYQDRERERAWVFRIARNVFLDDCRRERRTTVLTARTERVVPATQSVTVGLRDGLRSLSPDEREALLLADVAGLTYHEIAAATGTSVPTIRNRIYRARLLLRQTLAPPGPEITAVQLRHGNDD